MQDSTSSKTQQCCDSIGIPSRDPGLRDDLIRRKMRYIKCIAKIDQAIAFIDAHGESNVKDFLEGLSG